MRLEFLAPVGHEGRDVDVKRYVGAVVVRATPAGGTAVEFGPADGAPLLRLHLTAVESARLSAVLHAVATGRDDEVVITDSK
jgi:hypothetical protein